MTDELSINKIKSAVIYVSPPEEVYPLVGTVSRSDISAAIA